MTGLIIRKLKLIFIPCEGNKYRPEFLGSKFLYYYVILLLALKIVIVPFFAYLPKSAFFADLTKTTLIELTNKTRESLGLQPLKENSTLDEAAYLKAKDMLEKDYFSHQSPEGTTPWYWFKEAGYNYQFAGENLAIGFLDSGEVHQAWLESPSHKKNILNSNYNEMGVAVLKGNFQGGENTVVVQLFGATQTTISAVKTETPSEAPSEAPAETPTEATQTAAVGEEVAAGEAQEKAVSGEISYQASQKASEDVKDTFTFNLFSFLTSDYYNFLQRIIYGSLIFILISLFITVFFDIFIYRAFQIQYKDIALKAVGFSVLLVVLLFFDKGTIINLIPHSFNIY